MGLRACLAALLLALWGASSACADEAGVLRADEVLASSAEHFPAILRSLAARRAAGGDALSADGAFDLVFEADSYDRVSGVWSGGAFNSNVKQNLGPLGAQVYGGYRVSDGRFPIYENEYNTNTGGEFKVGGLFSLLRDRQIDQRRFRVADARLAYEQADLDLLMTKIGVQHKALTAYWRWVWSGRQLAVFEELLKIAEDRQSGLERQVSAGARARIFLTENRQNISRRQRLAAEARRTYLEAANVLSLYYRDAAGNPLAPEPDQLPPVEVLREMESVGDPITEDVPTILARQPELRILRASLERGRRELALRRNELLPRLDLTGEVSRDLGGVGEGGSTFDSTDTIVGVRFSVPLQRRVARGQVQRAEAELEAVQQSRRLREDQIEVEVRNIFIALEVAEEIVRIAGQEVAQAETMQAAERERFASGASDFFLVNVREETAADARIRYYLAGLEAQVARANYDAASLNLDRLGLDEDPLPAY